MINYSFFNISVLDESTVATKDSVKEEVEVTSPSPLPSDTGAVGKFDFLTISYVLN